MLHGRRLRRVVPVLVVAGAAVAPGSATAGVPVAVTRDLGTGGSASSSGAAVAGRTVVGYDGVNSGQLFRYDLDAPGASIRQMDDQAFQTNLSTIADADGPYVVGSQRVGTASTGAFVYDLRTDTVTKIPRLDFGGLQASASAVDDGLVVGSSEVERLGTYHAFAYDADGERQVLDLGTLGGPDSRAADVSGTAVVGRSDTADASNHAFVVDLSAAGRPMVDLGTLGGTRSAATSVDGDLVVGWSEVADGSRRAFSVRRSALPGPLEAIGTLGGTLSEATSVEGTVAVGTSTRADGSFGIWWTDLAVAPRVLHDLGTQATGAPAPSVADGTVVGTRQTSAGDRGFALDVSTGTLLDLDPVAGHDRTWAVDVAGDVVAGTSWAGATPRATAWTLTTLPSPTFRLARRTVRVSEGRVARLEVVRSGDLSTAADVRWRVKGTRHGMRPGKDLRRTRGTVHFAPGESTGWIRVKVRDDRRREGVERGRVRITVPTPGASVEGRSRAWLVIRASDRP